MGVKINGKNERSLEITERIKVENRTCWKYHWLLKDKHISTKPKLKVYKVVMTHKDENRLRGLTEMCIEEFCGQKEWKMESRYRRLVN